MLRNTRFPLACTFSPSPLAPLHHHQLLRRTFPHGKPKRAHLIVLPLCHKRLMFVRSALRQATPVSLLSSEQSNQRLGRSCLLRSCRCASCTSLQFPCLLQLPSGCLQSLPPSSWLFDRPLVYLSGLRCAGTPHASPALVPLLCYRSVYGIARLSLPSSIPASLCKTQ